MAKRPLLWIGRSLLAVLGLLLLIVVSLLIFRPTLSLEFLRPKIETTLTRQIGVPVSIREIRLRTSLWPTLLIRDARVATTDASGTREIALFDGLEAQVSLLPLLRKRVYVVKVRLDGVEIQLQPVMALLESDESQTVGDSDWALIGVRELEGVDIVIRHQTPRGESHELDLASITGGVSQIEQLELEVVGRLDDSPLKITVEGPPIGNLFDPPEVLPLTAEIQLADLTTSAQVKASKVRLLLDDLEGELDKSPFSGQLAVELSSELPSVTGELNLERLRLDRWLPEEEPDPERADDAETPLSRWSEISQIEIPYRLLDLVDTELVLSVDQIEGFPLDLSSLEVDLDLDRGALDLPSRLSIAGSQLQAKIRVEPTDSGHRFSLDAKLSEFPLDRLADLSEELTPLNGTIDQLYLSATTSGLTLGDLIEQASVDLEVTDSNMRLEGPNFERQPRLDIARLIVKHKPDEKFRIDLAGSLQGQPLRLGLRSKNLWELEPGGAWPIEVTLESSSVDSRLAGSVTPTDGLPIFDLEFQTAGERLSDLSTWLGISDNIELPFALAGSLNFGLNETRANISEGRLGRSSFSSSVLHTKRPESYLKFDIDIATFDVPELRAIVTPLEDDELNKKPFDLDFPILPNAIALPDTDLRLVVDRIVHEPEDITELSMDLEFKTGRLEPSTVSFRAGESRIEGTVELSWIDEVPRIRIDLEGNQIDLADLIETERIGEGLIVRAEEIDFSFGSEGSNLRQLLSLDSDIQLTGQGISVEMPFGESDRKVELSLDKVEVDAPEGLLLSAKASGELNGLAVQLALTTDPEDDFKFGDTLPVDLTALFGVIRTELRSDLHFPLDLEKQKIDLRLTAPMISSVNPLLDLQLPGVGPVSFTGSLDPRSSGFEIAIDEIVVGGSDLNGTVNLDTTGERLWVEGDINVGTFQPGDFLAEPDSTNTDGDDPESSDSRNEVSEPLRFPQDVEMLRQFDGALALRVEEIRWDETTGPGGELQAQLDHGHLKIGPLKLDQDDSLVDFQAGLEFLDSGLETELNLRTNDFHYGPIIQLVDPEAEGGGAVTIDTSLRFGGATLDELIASGSGHFDFTLYPHSVDTKVLDLWAASFRSVLRVFNPNNESVLNCITGRFSIDEGLMQADSSFIDTSQIRARGKGEVDLKDRTIQMRFRPQPKRRTFLSLATPVRISGPLDDADLDIAAGGLAKTAFRIYTWAITVFLEVFRRPLPTDGSDICIDPTPRGPSAIPD